VNDDQQTKLSDVQQADWRTDPTVKTDLSQVQELRSMILGLSPEAQAEVQVIIDHERCEREESEWVHRCEAVNCPGCGASLCLLCAFERECETCAAELPDEETIAIRESIVPLGFFSRPTHRGEEHWLTSIGVNNRTLADHKVTHLTWESNDATKPPSPVAM